MAPPRPDSYRRELSIGYRPAPAPYVGIKVWNAPRRFWHGSARRWD